MGASGSVAAPSPLQLDTTFHSPSHTPVSSAKTENQGEKSPTGYIVPSRNLIMTYARDPSTFESELKRKSSGMGSLHTRNTLKQLLQEVCSNAKVPEKDIDDFICVIDFSAGDCSIQSVIDALDIQMNKLLEIQSECFNESLSTRERAIKTAKNTVLSRTAAVNNLRKQTQLDRVTISYKEDPVSFAKKLHAASEDAFNSLSTVELATVLHSHVVGSTEDDIESTLSDYQAKLPTTTATLDINLFLEYLEQRVSSALRAEKQLAIERQKLAAEGELANRIEARNSKINELMQKAELDSITSIYTLQPAAFQAALVAATPSRSKNIPADKFVEVMKEVVKDATYDDIDDLLVDVTRKTSKTSANIPISAILSALKSRHTAALEYFKQAQQEESLLTKESISWREKKR
mmetsp:Transcript_14043/g.20996  ORF Transcript_14043/g.20996 Transcript_14043/m.20996 type:complete len:406 (+) Transcript_14043:117-1334(+)|eukprot:CAMPEP_0185029370 /NCGR_PEP_ID=MMETSP1103-20130426/15658_1 /TAXON_ID=36769 /ORGANISM="Paraphysomonas bandaiensis, Strain Caron Lab Isolate" /LENGTH=405 /DNA_ID=CAMNT_0027564087 /DNA_START=46 /DNA_END=1263 /DNA_ORIENTATION=-